VPSAATVVFGGQVMDGLLTSFNVTDKVQLAVFPLPSFAVSVIVSTSLWPLSTVFEAGLWVTAGFGLQLSLTEAAECDPTVPLQVPSAATVVFGGQVIMGGITSPTTTVVVPTPLQPFCVMVKAYVPAAAGIAGKPGGNR